MSKSDVLLTPAETAVCCDPGTQLLFPSGQGDLVACCAPLSQGALSVDQAEQVAPLLKALADPVRLRLMSLVASHPGGEACVCDLAGAFDLSQPTISHHLKVLHESGLLDRRKARRLGLLPGPHPGPGQPRRPDRLPGCFSRLTLRGRGPGKTTP